MEIIAKTKFDFIAKRWYAYTVSLLLVLLTVFMWITKGVEKYGIDYVGGHEIVVSLPKDSKSSKIRKVLEDAGTKDFVVQAFDLGSGDFSIKLPGDSGDSASVLAPIEKALKAEFKDVTIEKTDFVGPTIGSELKRKAIISIIVGLVGILIYITVRFEFAYALGAVVALFHDVVVSLGIYLLCGMTLSMATLAAALTIVGYSVNDTIIIFDRVREELFHSKGLTLKEIFNKSINSTLSRTIITSLLTLFSALALLVFGGGSIADLSLFLVVGIITGSYSTIFIASPIALAWEERAIAKN